MKSGTAWDQLEPPRQRCGSLVGQGPVYGVTFSSDGSCWRPPAGMAVSIWDAMTGVQKRAIPRRDGDAWSVSFGNNGKWIASGQDAVRCGTWKRSEVFNYRGAAFRCPLRGRVHSRRRSATGP